MNNRQAAKYAKKLQKLGVLGGLAVKLTVMIELAHLHTHSNFTLLGATATVLSMSSQVNALGQIVSGPAVGAIGARVSIRAALIIAGVLLLPVVGLYGQRKIGS